MRRATWLGIVAGLVAGIGIGASVLMRAYNESVGDHARLAQRLDEIESELDRERARTARGSIQDRMQLAARFELKEEVQRIEQERRRLAERIEFYERLLGERNAPEGLTLEKLEVRVRDDGKTAIRLLLAQVRQKPDWVRGTVELSVKGILGGAPTEIRLDRPVDFRFRFFQELQGVLVVPVGFVPDQLVVRVKQGRSIILDISRPWSAAVAEP